MAAIKASQALQFAHCVAARFTEDRCAQVAASLTYTTLLSLVPMITIALTVIAAFPGFSDYSVEIKIYLLTHMVPEAAGKIITVYMQQFADNAARLTTVGIAFLAATALMLMLTIDHALNSLWRVARPRPLLHRLLIYWAVLTIGPLLIGASLSITSWLVTQSMGLARQIDLPFIGEVLLRVMPIVLTTLAFAILYLIVPNRYVPRSHAVAGGLVAAIGFELMNSGFGIYVARFPTYKLVYGAFASIPIFLLWIYLSWLVVLFGAVIAASLSGWQGGNWRKEKVSGKPFYNALRILRELCTAFKTGQVATSETLRRHLHVGIDELESVLEHLSAADIVRRVVPSGWVLIRDPGDIKVADVYRVFVFRPVATHDAIQGEEVLEQLVAAIADRVVDEMKLSLAELFAEPRQIDIRKVV